LPQPSEIDGGGMNFLVDTNLPPSLVDLLVAQGHTAQHTRDIGLAQATDRAIWQAAKAAGACIITKDEDFVLIKSFDPTGPRVVWVRIGNAVRRVLLQRLMGAWPAVVAKLEQGESIVEVR
jgi:predicted nuclease of predicted toxin-antitoxin system